MTMTAEDTQALIEEQYSARSRRARITRSLTLWIPVAIMALMIVMAIFANLGWAGLPNVGLAPHDPNQIVMQDRYLPPAFEAGGKSTYFLGTDSLGRGILSRIIYGSRISLSISLIVIFITALIGTVLGIVAGFIGGRTDAFIMRFTDIALSFPGLLLAMLLAVAVGPGYWTVIWALSILGWAPYTRLIRGEALRIRESDYVAQARVNGCGRMRIMIRHVFPNVFNSLVVMMTLSVGMVILAEAVLSFLGFGVPEPTASWGAMVNDGRSDIATAWWISTFPGIAIALVVMAGNFLGDWLRDTLDPRLRQV